MADTFSHIAAYYDRLVHQFGTDPRACDYGHARSQELKFMALAGVLPLAGKRILEVGCGLADLADYLEACDAAVEYTGYDISPQMVAMAMAHHPGLSVESRNILEHPPAEPFDVVLATGIFYLLGDQASVLVPRLIAAMFRACTEALAFTTLSSWAPAPEPDEYYADPLKTLEFCRTLTPWLVLRHDYHPGDFTVYMYKERPQCA